jgi:hypothetical protein
VSLHVAKVRQVRVHADVLNETEARQQCWAGPILQLGTGRT